MAAAAGCAIILGGCTVGPAGLGAYRFEDTLSSPAASGAAESSAVAARVGDAVDASTLEPDVRALASPELRGRRRGTVESAGARVYLVRRLRAAGLLPLFGDSFEQPTYPGGSEVDGTAGPYATNVGAIFPATRPEAGWIVLVAHYDHRGVIRGAVQPGADDNASSVALLLALADALGRARPALSRHVALLFPDAEESPDVRTDRMGSSWFWRHPPLPAGRLHLAVVLDLMGGRAAPELQTAGLGEVLFVLGAEASPSLAALARGAPPTDGVLPVLLGLPMIEALPYRPGRRRAQSDYHGLREHLGRAFLFLSTGRTETYHTARDTPDTLDYARLGRRTRWVARLATHAADHPGALAWSDLVADPRADARTLRRLHNGIGTGTRFPWLLRRALDADRRRVEGLLRAWATRAPTPPEYRLVQLAALRLQAALSEPAGWWFALW